jgi:hypothetical protein
MTFLRSIYDVLLSIGKARAAAHLARNGQYEDARKMMLD